MKVYGVVLKTFNTKKKNTPLLRTKGEIFGLFGIITVLAGTVRVSLKSNLLFRELLTPRKLRKQSKESIERINFS